MSISNHLAGITTGLLHKLPPETAHRVAIESLRLGLGPRFDGPDDPILSSTVFGIDFPNPVGLAAGFDKNAEVTDALLQLGFGFVEIGTITPLPQEGNPKPRLFRDKANKALINRLGFNGQGLEAALARLQTRERRGIIGINVGRNKLSADGVADCVHCIARAARYADYMVVNVSSPNTPGLRDMQEAAALTALLEASLRSRDIGNGKCPLLVKIAPDLDDEALAAIVAVSIRHGISGLIVGNTTLSRPPGIDPEFAKEAGGLSGTPLRGLASDRLRATFKYAGRKIPLIGVGGVSSAQEAFARIVAGASLVQLYTGLIYEGPAVVNEIKTGLVNLLRAGGFSSVTEAVGSKI